MPRWPLFLCVALLLLLALPAAAVAPSRPETGNGVVLLRLLLPRQQAEAERLVLYREPGVARIDEFAAGRLPDLAGVLRLGREETALAVLGKRGEWLRVAYDDAGREGWLRLQRGWRYQPWESYLKGCTVRLLPGLKNGQYALRREPGEQGVVQETPVKDRNVRIVEVRGDWALALVELRTLGWLRWRDNDGRFLIAVTGHPER